MPGKFIKNKSDERNWSGEMINIGVVILNYMAYKATIDCVNCFLAQDQRNINLKIVIVDNCSSNNSEEILRNTFNLIDKVVVVKTAQNLGFANGNNFGYKELIHDFQPDFVIVSNDDILLNNDQLFHWIIDTSKKYKFDVLGPSVYSINGNYYQSPMDNFPTNKKECYKFLINTYISLIKVIIKKHLNIISINKKTNLDLQNASVSLMTDKKTLHGSFLIFSLNYFKWYDTPFDSGTFLYMEENILRVRCNIHGLKMLYSPDYCVNHLQAVSTNLINKDQFTRDYIRIKHIIKSVKYYISIL